MSRFLDRAGRRWREGVRAWREGVGDEAEEELRELAEADYRAECAARLDARCRRLPSVGWFPGDPL